MYEALSLMYAAAAPALFIFCRIVAFFVAVPIIGGEYVPIQTKAILAMAITLILLPHQMSQVPDFAASMGGIEFALLMTREFLVGISMGILLNLFFQAVHFGGDLIGRTAGYAAAESFNPSIGDMGGPIGNLMHVLLVLLFLLSNGHLYFIASLDMSYAMVPIGSFAVGPRLTLVVNEAADQLFTIGLALAFPILSSTLAVTVAEGVIARAVPQINILMISFATKIMVFLAVMITGLPVVVAFMGMIIQTMQVFLLKSMPALAGA